MKFHQKRAIYFLRVASDERRRRESLYASNKKNKVRKKRLFKLYYNIKKRKGLRSKLKSFRRKVLVRRIKRSTILLPKYRTIYKFHKSKTPFDFFTFKKFAIYSSRKKTRMFKFGRKYTWLSRIVTKKKKKKTVLRRKVKRLRLRFKDYKPTYTKIGIKTLYKLYNLESALLCRSDEDSILDIDIKDFCLNRLSRKKFLGFMKRCNLYANVMTSLDARYTQYPIRIFPEAKGAWLIKKTFAIIRYTKKYKLYNRKWPISHYRIAVENGLTERTIYGRTFGAYFQGEKRYATSRRSLKLFARFFTLIGISCFIGVFNRAIATFDYYTVFMFKKRLKFFKMLQGNKFYNSNKHNKFCLSKDLVDGQIDFKSLYYNRKKNFFSTRFIRNNWTVKIFCELGLFLKRDLFKKGISLVAPGATRYLIDFYMKDITFRPKYIRKTKKNFKFGRKKAIRFFNLKKRLRLVARRRKVKTKTNVSFIRSALFRIHRHTTTYTHVCSQSKFIRKFLPFLIRKKLKIEQIIKFNFRQLFPKLRLKKVKKRLKIKLNNLRLKKTQKRLRVKLSKLRR